MDRALEPRDTIGEHAQRGAIFIVHDLERRQLEALLREPLRMLERPGAHTLGPLAPMPQQELAHAMPRAQLILLRDFARADQIPERFGRGIRHPHRGEIAGAVAAREPSPRPSGPS